MIIPCSGSRFCECRECEREKHMGAAPRDPIGGLVGITGRELERLKKAAEEHEKLTADLAAAKADNERLAAERDEALRRARVACQRIIEAIGSAGPENVEDAAARVRSRIDRVRTATFEATRDEIAQLLEDNRDNPEGALNTSQMLIIIRALTIDTLADYGAHSADIEKGGA